MLKKTKQDGGDAMVVVNQSEIGELPEGWLCKKIKDVAKTYSGGTPSREKIEYYSGDIPWLKSGELGNKRIFHAEEYITKGWQL
jgi:type I restriction enzyme S subunit